MGSYDPRGPNAQPTCFLRQPRGRRGRARSRRTSGSPEPAEPGVDLAAADGVQNAGRRVISKIADHVFDVWYGTDTASYVECQDLNLVGPNAAHAVLYAPTRAREFRGLLRTLALPSDRVFVDLGSGKGRVLLLASDYGFRKVVGVELSAALCDTARANVRAYRKRKPAGASISVVQADAAAYRFCDDATVIFLFSPFGPVVVSAVLDNLRASIARRPRQVLSIYNNPFCQDVIEQAGYLRKLRDFDSFPAPSRCIPTARCQPWLRPRHSPRHRRSNAEISRNPSGSAAMDAAPDGLIFHSRERVSAQRRRSTAGRSQHGCSGSRTMKAA